MNYQLRGRHLTSNLLKAVPLDVWECGDQAQQTLTNRTAEADTLPKRLIEEKGFVLLGDVSWGRSHKPQST